MEIRSIIEYKFSPELKKKFEEKKKHDEEACKIYGNYLINMSNIIFDKCINLERPHFSREEEKCIRSVFYKFSDAHLISMNKFKFINNLEETNLLGRADDYRENSL